MENLEKRNLKYKIAEEFLTELRWRRRGREEERRKRGREEKTIKTAKLRRLEQGGKIIKEFVQKFR